MISMESNLGDTNPMQYALNISFSSDNWTSADKKSDWIKKNSDVSHISRQ